MIWICLQELSGNFQESDFSLYVLTYHYSKIHAAKGFQLLGNHLNFDWGQSSCFLAIASKFLEALFAMLHG